MKTKILLISGSPRKGNTEYLFSKIYNLIDFADKELVLLRKLNIKYCIGCQTCHKNLKCPLKDDMAGLIEKIAAADLLIIGSPNYFENVSALVKNFIDRSHPLYTTLKAKSKKTILIYIGGGKAAGTKKHLDQAFYGFIKYIKLDLVKSYSFQANYLGDIKKANIDKDIKDIIFKINSILKIKE